MEAKSISTVLCVDLVLNSTDHHDFVRDPVLVGLCLSLVLPSVLRPLVVATVVRGRGVGRCVCEVDLTGNSVL